MAKTNATTTPRDLLLMCIRHNIKLRPYEHDGKPGLIATGGDDVGENSDEFMALFVAHQQAVAQLMFDEERKSLELNS
jgi:hypothetical protein